ncbi:MAG: response regulator [Bacteroidia bacterium]
MIYNHILVVDDNPVTVFYNVDVTAEVYPDATIHSFEKTDDLIQAFRDTFGNTNEQLLMLLDISMPDRLGFELLAELETAHPAMDHLNVIMVTSSHLKSDMEKATRFPCIIGYVEKPLTTEKLIAAVNGTIA